MGLYVSSANNPSSTRPYAPQEALVEGWYADTPLPRA